MERKMEEGTLREDQIQVSNGLQAMSPYRIGEKGDGDRYKPV
ncbi:hypothetical protein J2T13_001822 [Paenibacillus sp. DS2015]